MNAIAQRPAGMPSTSSTSASVSKNSGNAAAPKSTNSHPATAPLCLRPSAGSRAKGRCTPEGCRHSPSIARSTYQFSRPPGRTPWQCPGKTSSSASESSARMHWKLPIPSASTRSTVITSSSGAAVIRVAGPFRVPARTAASSRQARREHSGVLPARTVSREPLCELRTPGGGRLRSSPV